MDLKNDPFGSEGSPGGRVVKILVITPDFPLWDGGISTVALEWAGGLHRLGHEITVLTPSQDTGDLEFDEKLPYETIRLRNVKARHAKTLYHAWEAIRLCRRRRFDVIVATVWYPSGIAAYCASRFCGVPFVVMVAGNEILHRRFQTPYWMGWMRRVFSGSSANLCISEAVAGKFRSVLGGREDLEGKIRLIRLGVDPIRFVTRGTGSPVLARFGLEGKRILLTLARLVERKGQDKVIEALPLIKKEIPDVRYVICGKGNDEARLRRIVEEKGVSGEVVFAGFVPNEERGAFYDACDVYVMPSREIPEKGDIEGFGITYLEANAFGKPVIGGKSGGVSEAVIDGVTGLLVDPCDVEAIAGACVRLLGDPELAGRLGDQGRDRIRREFNWDAICAGFSEILGEVVLRREGN
jgi:phosphatidylinositol alpha-1,6-mannosyltransferase